MNIKGHFETITRHKLLVMKYCFACGLYEQGLAHDLSKYSPTEFIPGCIYYQGDHSPNEAEREARGYTSAWLHHKGRNKSITSILDRLQHHESRPHRYEDPPAVRLRDGLRPCGRQPDLSGRQVHRRLLGSTTSTAKTTICSTPRRERCWKSCSRWCGTSGRSEPSRT